MDFKDYLGLLDAKIRSASTKPGEIAEMVFTGTTAEWHASGRWLHARRTGNTLVALAVYNNHGDGGAWQNYQDDLSDPHIEQRAAAIAVLLDEVPEE